MYCVGCRALILSKRNYGKFSLALELTHCLLCPVGRQAEWGLPFLDGGVSGGLFLGLKGNLAFERIHVSF